MDFVYDLLQCKGGQASLKSILEEGRDVGFDVRTIARAIWQWQEAGIMENNELDHDAPTVSFTQDHEKLVEHG